MKKRGFKRLLPGPIGNRTWIEFSKKNSLALDLLLAQEKADKGVFVSKSAILNSILDEYFKATLEGGGLTTDG